MNIILKKSGCKILEKLSYKEAAETLLDGELHRIKVLELIETEQQQKHFHLYTKENKESIIAANPGIIDNTWRC